MADSSLLAIQQKVRRLTRSLSEAQLTTPQLNQYINTYVLYDFPETLRLFNLRSTFSFYTSPFVDVYSTTSVSSPLYDFTNKYITTDSPVYIAGYQALYSESRNQFFGIYPLVNSIASIGVYGDGATNQFAGVINSQQANTTAIGSNQVISLLQNNVMFSSIDANGNGLVLQDTPILDGITGLPTIYGSLYNPYVFTNEPKIPTTNPQGTPYNPVLDPHGFPTIRITPPYINAGGFPTTNYINYVTGAYYITFPLPPAAGATINSQTVPTNPSLPQALLFYDGAFTVRPVPDQPYRVDMEVYTQPTELLSNGQTPDLSEWWQLIAFNAAKKIFEDRMDYDSISMILPSLKEQERLVLRRTIVQQTSQRGSTIYSDQSSLNGYGPGWGNGGGNF